jgi:phosphoserine phosphatase
LHDLARGKLVSGEIRQAGIEDMADTGVALHAKPLVAAQCQVRVNHGDLTALLYLQGYAREEFAR